MTLARLRWKIDGRTLTLADGTKCKLPRRTPEAVLRELARLPHDYLELGHRSADLHDDARLAERYLSAARGEAADWKMKYENIKGQDIESLDKITAILSDDLELACNLLIRISVALGIQPGGEFFNLIKNLVEKYGMTMHYAKDYNASGTPAEYILEQGPATVKISQQGKVEVQPALPPGEEEAKWINAVAYPCDCGEPECICEDEVSEKGQLEEDLLQELEERKRQNG